MPSDTAPKRPRAAAQLRAIAIWALGLVLTLGLAAVLAWGSVILAVFGLAGVALGVAIAMIALSATFWRRGMLPTAVAAIALVLPAAAIALEPTRFDRSIGLLTVRPSQPSDLSRDTYRRGTGPIFLDLRDLNPARGSVTRISARADNGPITVALPHDVCVQPRVRFHPKTGGELADTARAWLRGIGLDSGNPYGMAHGSTGLTTAAYKDEPFQQDQLSSDANMASYGLQAYGRTPLRGLTARGDTAEWVRETSDGGAAKVYLDLQASEQIVLRDYPDWAAPLSNTSDDGWDQVAGYDWPMSLQGPLSPGNQRWAQRMEVRTLANRQRWLAWEDDVVRWGAAQARRYAGPCASERELRERSFRFQTQPGAVRDGRGRVQELVSGVVKRSKIEQRPGNHPDTVLDVEVNGLGETRVVLESRSFRPVTMDSSAGKNRGVTR